MPEETFAGYRRPDGRVGVRNHVAIIPSCGCALHAATLIASEVEGAQLVQYDEGCSLVQDDLTRAVAVLTRYGTHPNVVGSVVVSLGCETLDAADLAARIGRGWVPVELLVIQEQGGTRRTVDRGVALAQQMLSDAASLKREPCRVSELTIGLECGGSDATSGLAANPAVGEFSDLMVAAAARVILAETSELLGAEHVLAERASDPDVAARAVRTVAGCERVLKATGEDFEGKQPSPGKIRGGITTGEEKALGDVRKGGSTPVVDVLTCGEPPRKAGLSFMDTPGNDALSVTALVAAGSQIVVFTTGRGNPLGNAIAPVIKITANGRTFNRMRDDMDLDASPIITGEETFGQVGRRIYDLCMAVAEGEQPSAERLGHAEFDVVRLGPVY